MLPLWGDSGLLPHDGENRIFLEAEVTSVLPFLFGKMYACMYVVCKHAGLRESFVSLFF